MLTADTKRHIDAARQVLVGKVPNPISQIQEITNALVYKFMDDMDEKAASMGGKRRYFTGEYTKFSWRAIMDPKIGAHERIGLYTEALSRLSKNPNLPELFRNIFRNAYLPFNDGRVLTLFLKEIDYFDYSKSQELGDAYEYLLSIMGSQGDAGQFRTPRHIIDFMVAVINPTKNDSVLDPACGTAGFLISAYKHVMAQHDGVDEEGKSITTEKPLTADEKKHLHAQYKGFDIDDSMVKMAQVNLYLHGFPDPKIMVHDTLSSQDYWQDRYDVILANPPFMSPKGGSLPHNKFGIKSTRSEVLFVDYITSHLKPHGRAAIIVPEGIIFHSGKAHTELRKNLVNDGLYAVVSLPSGVFNPYAGVKTSILLFDNSRAKETDQLLFVKINNDGYDLGATKRKIAQNDLPEAEQILNLWKQGKKSDSLLAIYVSKSKIAEGGDYNLSGDRYFVAIDYSNSKWPMVEMGAIANIEKGSAITKKDTLEGRVPVIAGGQTPAYYHSESNRYGEVITISASGAYAGYVNYFDTPIFASDCSTIQSKDSNRTSTKYIYYVLKAKQDDIYSFQQGGGQPHVYPKDLKTLRIPHPPLVVQEQIVAELDGYFAIIAGAKQIVSNWKPKIDIDPKWEKVKLGEVLDRVIEQVDPQKQTGKVFYVGLENIESNSGKIVGEPLTKYEEIKSLKNAFCASDLLYGKLRPNLNKVWLADREGICSTDILVFRGKQNSLTNFYWYLLLSSDFVSAVKAGIKGAQLPRVGFEHLKNLTLPFPPLPIQKQIVAKIEAERALVDSARQLIEIYEQKTKEAVSKLWSEKS